MSIASQTVEVKRRVLRDEQTGREIWQISPPDKTCVAPYMYIRAFTPDERFLFYVSDATGLWQLYRCEIESGETMQVTNEAGLPIHGANIHPLAQEVFYKAGGRYWAVHAESLEKRLVLDLDRHEECKKAGGQVMFSQSGKYFSLSYNHDETCHGIARVACDTGALDKVYVRPEGFVQHVQFANVDDDLMSFAVHPDHQQEWDQDNATRARAWLMDARTGAAEPLLTMPPPCTATHEYWGPTGERIYFHKKTRPSWVPTWIACLDRHTRETRILFGSDTVKLGHSYVNHDETKIVSDSQESGRNELLLIDVATGEAEVLCWPNSSIKDSQLSHVHPSFSPKGSYVLYTSDVSGVPQVYLVPLAG